MIMYILDRTSNNKFLKTSKFQIIWIFLKRNKNNCLNGTNTIWYGYQFKSYNKQIGKRSIQNQYIICWPKSAWFQETYTDSTTFVNEALEANTSQVRTNVSYLNQYFYQIGPTSLSGFRHATLLTSMALWFWFMFTVYSQILEEFDPICKTYRFTIQLIMKYISTVYRK